MFQNIKPDDEKTPFNKSSINITKLYNGEEVLFQIPSYQWMIDNKWISDSTDAELENTALYPADFKIFMLSDRSEPATSIISKASAILAAKLFLTQAQGNEYRITPTVTHTFEYINNQERKECFNQNEYIEHNPYGEDYSGICPTTYRLSTNDQQPIPSVFSLWKIKVSPRLPLPKRATGKNRHLPPRQEKGKYITDIREAKQVDKNEWTILLSSVHLLLRN